MVQAAGREPVTRLGSIDRDVQSDEAAALLRAEAAALGWFIVGRPVASEFIERYVTAHEHVGLGSTDPREHAIVAFAVAHPRLLPSLEAAAALVRPHGLLHRKAILMTAILEASPSHADEFLPRDTGLPSLAALALRVGMTTAMQVAIGLPLMMTVSARA